MDHIDRPDDLDEIGRLLRERRPELEPLQLDRIKVSTRARARRPASSKGAVMKSRLAILSILVLGIMMGGAGTGIVIAQVSGGTGAANTVYADDDDPGDPGDPRGGGELQASSQEEAAGGGGGELPFTGFVAVPLLVGGVALLGTGLLLRRGTR